MLLLVMLVVSILFVLIGQFSYSVSLDRALAQNHLVDAQARLDLVSAAEVFLAAVSQDEEGPISIDLPSGTARIAWASEAGKFNINTLRSEDPTIPLEQFERLFQLLEEHGSVDELGLANRIADFVITAERPLLGIRELAHIDGITDEVLEGGAGKKGLTDFLTVYSDGTVNIGDAPAEVVASLDESLNNEKTIDLLIQRLEDPRVRVPDYVSRLAQRLRNSVTTDSRSYRATITISGNRARRRLEVAVRKEGDAYRMVLFNELDESHEQFVE